MRTVFVHARPETGSTGHAVGAICSGGRVALVDLPGEQRHVGLASYEIVNAALDLAAKAGEQVEIVTSYQVIARHLAKGRCGSEAMTPLFARASELLAATGSTVVFRPGAENPAVSAVMEAWRPAGEPVPPIVVDPGLRARLIAAGWTPPPDGVDAGPDAATPALSARRGGRLPVGA